MEFINKKMSGVINQSSPVTTHITAIYIYYVCHKHIKFFAFLFGSSATFCNKNRHITFIHTFLEEREKRLNINFKFLFKSLILIFVLHNSIILNKNTFKLHNSQLYKTLTKDPKNKIVLAIQKNVFPFPHYPIS